MAEPEFKGESPHVLTAPGPFAIRSLDEPDRTRSMHLARIDVVDVGDSSIGRSRLEPGWHWNEDVRAQAGTDTCQLLHRLYIVSGHLGIRTPDGTERVAGPGEAVYLPPGHDAWVEGQEPVVNISFSHSEASPCKR